MTGTTVGIDIGGANIKLADVAGNCVAEPFALWLAPDRLGEKVRQLLSSYSNVTRLAITMTGELADCYATRREGVDSILCQIAGVFPEERSWVYSLDEKWLTPALAQADPWKVAASNWHLLGTWIARSCRATKQFPAMLLIDVGSTTVDVVPLAQSRVCTTARTDRQRLQSRQLVYTGAERTPVAAIVREVLVKSQRCPVMAERFATSEDAYLATGSIKEQPENCDTADGRPKTMICAQARIARMVGEDSQTLSPEVIRDIASQIIEAQVEQICQAIERNLNDYFRDRDSLPVLVCSGHGRELLERLLPRFSYSLSVVWLDEFLSPQLARCAPSYAAAQLLDEAMRMN